MYVIIPVMDNTYESFINLFFSQLFDELYKLAADHHAKLPHQVDFILDEFVNLVGLTWLKHYCYHHTYPYLKSIADIVCRKSSLSRHFYADRRSWA